MRTLRHPKIAGARAPRESRPVRTPGAWVRPACALLELSAAGRKQRLHLAWQRSAKTGELQGRWQLGGAHSQDRAVKQRAQSADPLDPVSSRGLRVAAAAFG